MRLLALNCGSSSVKFAVVDTTTGERIVSGAQETGADGPASAIDAVVDQIAGNAQPVAGPPGTGHRGGRPVSPEHDDLIPSISSRTPSEQV